MKKFYEIFNHFYSDKKPNKADAFDLLAELAQELDPEKGSKVYNILGSLTVYFRPTLPKKPKTAWQWVAKAAAKQDVRYYLNHVYVERDRIIATDGHRLHMASNDDKLPDGFYCPKTMILQHEPDYAKFPDVDRVLHGDGTKYAGQLDSLDGVNVRPAVKDVNYSAYTFNDDQTQGAQVRYLNDAMCYGDSKLHIPAEIYTSLLVKNDIGLAIVMPMKLDAVKS